MCYRKIKTLFSLLSSLAVLVPVLFLFAGVLTEDRISVYTPEILASDEKNPHFPGHDESGENEYALKDAIPCNAVPAQIFRRSDENSVRHFFRNGDADSCENKIILSATVFIQSIEKCDCSFVFQKILRNSLPPRAGPVKA